MQTKVKTVTIIATTQDIPDGVYQGKWSGYTADVVIEGKFFQLGTEDGVRGLDIPCIVRVDNGSVTVETRKNDD